MTDREFGFAVLGLFIGAGLVLTLIIISKPDQYQATPGHDWNCKPAQVVYINNHYGYIKGKPCEMEDK